MNRTLHSLLLVALVCLPVFAFAEEDTDSTVSTIDFFQYVADWIAEGSYQQADSILERVSVWVIVWYLEFKISAISMASSIADVVVGSFGFSELIRSSLNSLDSRTASLVFYMKIPDAMAMILSAYLTRFILELF